jgi:hypothetical protein
LKTERFTLVTDRDKGLKSCDNEFPLAYRGFCCQHIAANIKDKHGSLAQDLFWKLAKARNIRNFDHTIDELKAVKPEALKYVRGIPASLWARYCFPGPRFGYLTSNIAESANSIYKDARDLPVLQMLIEIYNKEAHKRFLRQQSALKLSDNERFTPWGYSLLTVSLRYARGNKARMGTQANDHQLAVVTQMSDQRQFSVNLTDRTCSCVRWQDTGIPCGHAITAINTVKKMPMDFMPSYWSRQDWVAAYDSAMPPITMDMVHEPFLSQEREHQRPSVEGEGTQVRMEDEISDGNEEGPEGVRGIAAVEREAMQCEPPLTRVPRGRPAKKRMNKGEMRRKLGGQNLGGLPDIPDRAPPRCSTCKGLGHYARTCRKAHT